MAQCRRISVYLRSLSGFHDGDGNGDLNGLQSGLKHIAELGCDALWLNPIYLSPQRDHGYDIADYRSIDPMYVARWMTSIVSSRRHTNWAYV